MNIPKGYRILQEGETILSTDYIQRGASPPIQLSEERYKDIGKVLILVSRPYYGNGYQFLRKLETSPWISVKERLPEANEYPVLVLCGECDVRFARRGFEDDGVYAAGFPCFAGVTFTNEEKSKVTHWMRLPAIPEPIAPPITISEGMRLHEIVFNKDGSLKVGCVTIGAAKMDSIIERRKEVMKG